MLSVHYGTLFASLVILAFFWTTDSGWIEKLVATGIVAVSILLMFVGIHFLVPLLMQTVVAIWAMIRIQYG